MVRMLRDFSAPSSPVVVLALALVGALLSACSTSSGSYGTAQMTTNSLPPPRPAEGMLREPSRPYGDGYGLGRNYTPPVSAPRQGQYQWNGNTTRLQEGSSPALPPAQANIAADGRRIVTVRPGDTLYSISRQQGVSMQDLMSANRLSTTAVHAGQTLVLPTAVR